MAIYPGARVRLIPPGSNDPRITVIGAILHTDAGNSKSLYGYFNGPSGGIESHFHVPKELQVEQYRDTAYEADANYHGNSFKKNGKLYGYVSIETQGFATDSWNDYQLAEIKKLLLWASKTHHFPLVKCTSPTSPGVGYHTMWGAPGPWTPLAKDCPGAKRIAQYNHNLVPWFATGAPAVEESDMEFTDAVPGLKDPDGSDVSIGEALPRGVSAYRSVIEGGALETRVSLLEARIDSNTDAHADYAYEAVTEGGVVDKRVDAIQAALSGLNVSPDNASLEQRVAATEAVLSKLKEALS